MSYGQQSIKTTGALHFIGFPNLVRVCSRQLQIQLPKDYLNIEGKGLDLLFRDLLAGELTSIETDRVALGVTVDQVTIEPNIINCETSWSVGECCPVPDDLLLLETETHRDYLARSTLEFFGRFGRRKQSFLIGFTDRSYRIEAMPGRADELAASVLASRFAANTANIFTTLAPDYFLPWPEIYRHHVAVIDETAHSPADWFGDKFVDALFTHNQVGPASIVRVPPQSKNTRLDAPDI